jgi:hypothetical protein
VNEKLHRELWTSWASLLRSYAAAHGLSSTQHAVVEVSEDRITVRHGTSWISFTAAEYESSKGNKVPFYLTEHGTAVVDGNEEEMDLTAERLARELIAA